MPHSGTRTLVEHLGLNAVEEGLRGGRWWHFGNCAELLKRYPKVPLHVPVRDPMDVARSWACRRKTGKPERALVGCYQHMFEILDAEAPRISLHRIEDLPRLAGMNEHAEVESLAKVAAYRDIVRREIVAPHRDFFTRFGYEA